MKRTVCKFLIALCVFGGRGADVHAQGATGPLAEIAPAHQGVLLNVQAMDAWAAAPDKNDTFVEELEHPAIINVEGLIAEPLGKYYLYHSARDHNGIGLVTSDSIEGPWNEYQPDGGFGPLPTVVNPARSGSNYAAPDIRWMEEDQQFFLWCHEDDGYTDLFSSTNGVDFTFHSTAIQGSQIGATDATHTRCYEYPLERNGTTYKYIMLYSASVGGVRGVWLASSQDAISWTQEALPLVLPTDGEYDPSGDEAIFGPAFVSFKGKNYVTYQESNIADGGKLKYVEVDPDFTPLGTNGTRYVLVDPPAGADPDPSGRYRGSELLLEDSALYCITSGGSTTSSFFCGNASVDPEDFWPVAYNVWIHQHGINASVAAPNADADSDGRPNIDEFVFDSNPTNNAYGGKRSMGVIDGASNSAFSVTLPVRRKANLSWSPDQLSSGSAIDYTFSGSTNLTDWTLGVEETVPAQVPGLPALSPGLQYRTFTLDTPVASSSKGFIKAEVSSARTFGGLGETHTSLQKPPAGSAEVVEGLFTSALLGKDVPYRIFTPLEPQVPTFGMPVAIYALNLACPSPRPSSASDREIIEDLIARQFVVVAVDFSGGRVTDPLEWSKDLHGLVHVFGGKWHTGKSWYTFTRKNLLGIPGVHKDKEIESVPSPDPSGAPLTLNKDQIYVVPPGYTVELHHVFNPDTGIDKKPELFFDIIYPMPSEKTRKLPILLEQTSSTSEYPINANTFVLYSWLFNGYAFASTRHVQILVDSAPLFTFNQAVRYLRWKADDFSLNGIVSSAGISKSAARAFRESHFVDGTESIVDDLPYGGESSKIAVTMPAVPPGSLDSSFYDPYTGDYPVWDYLSEDSPPVVLTWNRHNGPAGDSIKVRNAYYNSGLQDRVFYRELYAGHEYGALYRLKEVLAFWDRFCKPGPINRPPAFSGPITGATRAVDAEYRDSIAGSASDPTRDVLTYSLVTTGTWLNVSPNGALRGTPGEGDLGMNAFIVQVDDAFGGSDTTNLTIELGTNSPPAFSGPITGEPANLNVDYKDTIAGSASDPDGNSLIYSLETTGTWLNVASDGALSGIPVESDAGTNTFTVRVDEVGGSDTETLTIYVSPTYLRPEITADFANSSPGRSSESVVLNINAGVPSDSTAFLPAGGRLLIDEGVVYSGKAFDNLVNNFFAEIRAYDSFTVSTWTKGAVGQVSNSDVRFWGPDNGTSGFEAGEALVVTIDLKPSNSTLNKAPNVTDLSGTWLPTIADIGFTSANTFRVALNDGSTVTEIFDGTTFTETTLHDGDEIAIYSTTSVSEGVFDMIFSCIAP